MRLREAVGALGVHYQAAYGWVRQQQLPARKVGRDYEISADHLRAFAATREDCWTAHHLSADLPAEDVARFAAEAGAALVVPSTATPQASICAGRAAGLVTTAYATVTVLVGHPGDRLRDLQVRARKAVAAGRGA